MRCLDCLPLLEEYFDGEVTGQAAEHLAAHLSACADCSAALDALSFEQEVYARYDRGGLEVTLDLWARVSAEIARTPTAPESPAAGRPFLSRARARFAAALGLLKVRPELATALALLLFAAAAGTLWLSRRAQPVAPALEVAKSTTAAPPAPSKQTTADAAAPSDRGSKPAPAGSLDDTNQVETFRVAPEPREAPREVASKVGPARREGAGINVDALLAEPASKAIPVNVRTLQGEHDGPDEIAKLLVNARASDGDIVTGAARPLDPEQKELARHVERAQMLLRSIKNARAGDLADSDISYEKKLSRKLLAENATLQLEADVKGDGETKQVLERIEPFLLEIANMGEQPSREEVRSIGERVRRNEIVAALEVY